MKATPFRTILVPVDFSELARDAIATALRLAQGFGGKLHLVHVDINHPLFDYMRPSVPVPRSLQGFSEQTVAGAAKRLRVLGRDFGIPEERCYLQPGTQAFAEICRVADAIEADLIVMPTHGGGGIRHLALGSTAERVVQHAHCPVWIHRKPFDEMFKVLVPVDFSDQSRSALEVAVALAARAGAQVTVLHVVQFGFMEGYFAEKSPLPAGIQQEANAQMRDFISPVDFGAVQLNTRIESGSPGLIIGHLAEREEFDLIVTGTHGWSGLERMLLGSTADLVVRHARVPVLVVPSNPDARRQKLEETAPAAGLRVENTIAA